jgi:mannose-1-phosphate guanylyltransferase/mannose-6-phosphate isomerase
MSGGSGTRLWPMSRAAKPKQFLKLLSEKSMFQETALRVHGDEETFLDPIVIAGKRHGPVIAEQLVEIGVTPAKIILEPCARNTAAVAAVAAAWVARGEEDALILLMPADHHIANAEAFRRVVAKGAKAAESGHIVTFGIKPQSPHTGYGYIHTGEKLMDSVYEVAAFKEKPKLETAQEYLKDGGYFWNAGIFLFSARVMLEELDKHAPDIKRAATAALDASVMTGAARRLDEEVFSTCPANSVDYAVMEKTDKAAIVAPVDVGWSDIGSWSEVPPDPNNDRIITIDSKNNVIRTDGPVVAAAGVEDLIIVATGDAVLVARRENAQDVRQIVEELKKRGREDLT